MSILGNRVASKLHAHLGRHVLDNQLGEALMEEQEFRLGVHKTPSMLDYKSPTAMDMCPVETLLIEDPDPTGPFGAKEVGQGPLLPMPPAVCCL